MANDVLAQEIIHALAEAVLRGGHSLQSVPGLLRRLIDEGLWQERNINGELVHFDKKEFRAFVEAKYPVGLSTTLETLEALCGHEPKVLDFIGQAKKGKPGRPIGSTNAGKTTVDARGHVVETNGVYYTPFPHKSGAAKGTSAERARNQLREHAYDIDRETGDILGVKNERVRQLYEDVLEGRKKPNRAAIEAGFRAPRIAVRLDDMQSAADTLAAQLTIEQLDELIARLAEYRDKRGDS